jgi:hypothetical protein
MSGSQIGQDLYTIQRLKEKKHGVFIDIGCSTPKTISNTYLLEAQYGWTGLAIDIAEHSETNGETWSNTRPNSKLIIKDALSIDYDYLFKEHSLPVIIDYLTIDLEPPDLTLSCLFKIPFHNYKFRVITFETDAYRPGGDKRRNISREYLNGLGYILDKEVNQQDDFYLYPLLLE